MHAASVLLRFSSHAECALVPASFAHASTLLDTACTAVSADSPPTEGGGSGDEDSSKDVVCVEADVNIACLVSDEPPSTVIASVDVMTVS